jgi:tRNA (guanine37-N1)-methyltransferase
MRIKILTIFPEVAKISIQESILKRAAEKGMVDFEVIDIRDFCADKHATVDDTPYGGGGGMVLKPYPLATALEKALSGEKNFRIILTSAGGSTFDQRIAQEFSRQDSLIFICGHYTGVDERIKELFPLEEVSLGDFVLTGGELAALVMIDATVRLIPKVLGNFESAQNDSFQDGLLGYPHYTKPREFRGKKVPDVLLSGNHQQVARWRREKALEITYRNRPELLNQLELTPEEFSFLESLKAVSEERDD